MVDLTDAEPQLEVRNLRKAFGNEFELSTVDVTVGKNEIVALLGPSGCGKTTTLRCIAGVEIPDSGSISISGTPVFGDNISLPPEQRDIGLVYQNYAIWPHKTVYENVVFPLEYADDTLSQSRHESRVEEVLDIVEISDLKDEPATDLSGGQQQRTALARSLVYDPDLLLLDEPLSNLDRELRKSMRNQLQRIQHEMDVSMLYVTHDQEEAFYLADKVLIMNDGEVVERGTPRELFHRPESAFTRRFIGDRNQFSGNILRENGEKIVDSGFLKFPVDNVDYVAQGVCENEVTWFLRPSDVNIGSFSGSYEGRIELQGTVIAEGILGETYEITVQISNKGDELVIHTSDRHNYERGEQINLQIKPQAIQIYPDQC